jgi:hypothetical protein
LIDPELPGLTLVMVAGLDSLRLSHFEEQVVVAAAVLVGVWEEVVPHALVPQLWVLVVPRFWVLLAP